jgi:phosphoglycolate phosphatase
MPTDEPIRLEAPDPSWPARFEVEREALEQAIGQWVDGGIHHVGSTAVVGLEAKPIIDILAGVSDLESARACFGPLAQLDYLYAPYLPEEMHWFCKPDPAHRTHHLHLVPTGSRRYREELSFRDRLRADPKLAVEYAALKRDLAERYREDREAYTEAKGAFIRATGPMAGRPEGSVLFDLDGVLVDSRAAIAGSINFALSDHGLPTRTAESLYRFIGPPLASAFAELTGCPSDSTLVASCLRSYRARYAEASLRETIVTPGIDAALHEMAQRYRLAVATSKPLAFAEPLLSTLGLRPFFVAVAGPDLGVQGESKADTIAASLKMLQHPERAVMVGDRSHDIVGAQAHRLPSVGVTWGIGSREELHKAGAGSMVDTPSELPLAVGRILEDRT